MVHNVFSAISFTCINKINIFLPQQIMNQNNRELWVRIVKKKHVNWRNTNNLCCQPMFDSFSCRLQLSLLKYIIPSVCVMPKEKLARLTLFRNTNKEKLLLFVKHQWDHELYWLSKTVTQPLVLQCLCSALCHLQEAPLIPTERLQSTAAVAATLRLDLSH